MAAEEIFDEKRGKYYTARRKEGTRSYPYAARGEMEKQGPKKPVPQKGKREKEGSRLLFFRGGRVCVYPVKKGDASGKGKNWTRSCRRGRWNFRVRRKNEHLASEMPRLREEETEDSEEGGSSVSGEERE